MTRQKIRVEEHISNKERHIELLQVEKTELENSCERLASQMKEVESANSKLRVELEEVNTNFRKIMRAQEHLHKGKKPDIKQEQENKRSYEVERVSMGCEDLLSQCVRRIESINQAGV